MPKLILLALSLLLAGCGVDPEPVATDRVLVFSRTTGYRHASIEPGIEAVRGIGADAGFEVDATEDPSVFRDDELARYGVVVFLLTTGDVLDDGQQAALTRYIRAGGGFVGVHSASDTEYDWPWYGRLVGAYFTSHPNDPNVRQGTVLVADGSHPSTEMLPSPWVREDEWYDLRDFAPDLKVLLNVDESSYKSAAENPAPAPRPIAWYHDYEGGRAWYTALGHTSESFSEPLFLDHLEGGLRYALGGG